MATVGALAVGGIAVVGTAFFALGDSSATLSNLSGMVSGLG